METLPTKGGGSNEVIKWSASILSKIIRLVTFVNNCASLSVFCVCFPVRRGIL